jgi:ferredoxin-thioredoxin reductase catalytic subunit
MQIPVIITDNEELEDVVKSINNRLDQIANEFNSLAVAEDTDTTINNDDEFCSTVNEPLHAKYIRFGVMPLANAPNGSLFEDTADGLLKHKSRIGIVTVLT